MPTNPTGRDIYTRGGVLDQVAALAWDQHRVEAGLPTFPRDIMTAEFLTQDEDVCDGFRTKVLPFVLRTLQADDETRPQHIGGRELSPEATAEYRAVMGRAADLRHGRAPTDLTPQEDIERRIRQLRGLTQ